MGRWRRWAAVALLVTAHGSGTAAGAAAAAAADRAYPHKPVRVVIGFAPGGSDIVARPMLQRFQEKLGQPFVIDFRPGASATLGADSVAKSAPDGHTLLFAAATFALTAVSYPKLPYDTVRDFAPVAFIGSIPFVLTVHPSLPTRTVQDFVALAKRRPAELHYSSAGPGSLYQVAGLLFAKETGVRVVHVPYKGTGPAIVALFTGEVQFAFPNLVAVSPHLSAGRLRALAVGSAQRSPLAPELPTMTEAGVPRFDAGTWYGLIAPRGTPRHAIDILHRETLAYIQSPDAGERLQALGLVPSTLTSPEEFGKLILADIEKWRGAIKGAGNLTSE